MSLVLALAVGVLFGSGAYLVLKPDLFRVVVGIVLTSNAAALAVMSSGVARGREPIYPLPGGLVSDPLVQAMALTALVIGFATTALLLALVFRVYSSLRTVDLDELSRAEVSSAREPEREEMSV